MLHLFFGEGLIFDFPEDEVLFEGCGGPEEEVDGGAVAACGGGVICPEAVEVEQMR